MPGFDLQHSAVSLNIAADGWLVLAQTWRDAAAMVRARSRSVVKAGWEGVTADAYGEHEAALVGTLDRAELEARGAARHLDLAAGSVRAAQGRLDAEWARISHLPVGLDGTVTGTLTAPDAALVQSAVTAAGQIRAELDQALATDAWALDQARTALQGITTAWRPRVDGRDPGWLATLPPEGTETGVLMLDDTVVVNAGADNDEVTVGLGPDSTVQVVVNGEVLTFGADTPVVIVGGGGSDEVSTGGTSSPVTVVGGDGDDRVFIPAGTAFGGAGDDRVQGREGSSEIAGGAGNDALSGTTFDRYFTDQAPDLLYGGSGHDTVEGDAGGDLVVAGSGDDFVHGRDGRDVLVGGTGHDVLYGGVGDDRLIAQGGVDFLSGGDGDDLVQGGRGSDQLAGGAGEDTLEGGDGDDVLYAGPGADTASGGAGEDLFHGQADDAHDAEAVQQVEVAPVPSFIEVGSDDDFRGQVADDLALLQQSPAGQRLLAELERVASATGQSVVIYEAEYVRSSADDNGGAVEGQHAIHYNALDDGTGYGPPALGLFHELAHLYDFMSGNDDPSEFWDDQDPAVTHPDEGVLLTERTATGLPIDHDGNATTAQEIDPRHPYELSSNSFLEELLDGAPLPSYQGPKAPDDAYRAPRD